MRSKKLERFRSVALRGSANLRPALTGGLSLVLSLIAVAGIHAQTSQAPVSHKGAADPFSIPETLTELARLQLPAFKADTLRISDLGGKADAVHLNTVVIQDAIDRLTASGGGVVYIGPGQWLTGPITLKDNVNLHIAAGALLQFTGDFDQYPLVSTVYEGEDAVRCQAPISAIQATHIAITGKGIIDGAGDSWRMVKKAKTTASQWKDLLASGGVLDAKGSIWYPSEKSLKGALRQEAGFGRTGQPLAYYDEIKDYLRPNLLSLISCEQVLLEGVTFQNSPAWCLHPLLCKEVIIRNIQVRNPWYAQNGDGLDLESCKNVLIEGSSFDVGDDGICMKSGRDEEGRKRGVPTENVLIQHCNVYHAHGGFVVGSEMSGGVRNVAIRQCNFLGTDIGLRFKTTRGRGGVVENIYATQINMHGIKGDAIRFNMYYAAKDPVPLNGEQREVPKEVVEPVSEATPQFRGFFISDINCNGADHSLFFRGLPEMAIKDIHLRKITMKTKRGIELIQADGIDIQQYKGILTTPDAPYITLQSTRNSRFADLDLQRPDTRKPAVVVAGAASSSLELRDVRFNNASLNVSSGVANNSSLFQFMAGARPAALQIK